MSTPEEQPYRAEVGHDVYFRRVGSGGRTGSGKVIERKGREYKIERPPGMWLGTKIRRNWINERWILQNLTTGVVYANNRTFGQQLPPPAKP